MFRDNLAPSIGSGVIREEGATGGHRNDLLFRKRGGNDGRQGTAIHVDGAAAPSQVDLDNVTIADHVSPDTAANGGAIHVELFSVVRMRDSILWNDSREFGTDDTATTVDVAWSISARAGTGNRLLDPRFADPAAGDYHLRSSAGRYTPAGFVIDGEDSQATDAGDPVSLFAQETAPNGGRIKLGAGGGADASRSPTPARIFGDGFDWAARAAARALPCG